MMSAIGFRLVGTDDSSSSQTFVDNELPTSWNKDGPGNYCLRYKHDQSSLEFLVKVLKLGSRTLINAIATETDKTSTLDISTADFLSRSFYPYDVKPEDTSTLVNGFISSNRVADFVAQYKLKIIQNLIPGMNKEGYVEETTAAAESASSSQQARQPPGPARPSVPQPPGGPEMFPQRSHIPPRNPLEIGRRDLDPLATQIQPNPFQPPRLFPDSSDGDGMFVGPGHPMFGGIGRAPNSGMGPAGMGPWGGDGFLPPMGAPPGARFDPVGPFGMPGGPGGRGGGGLPRGQRGGDPDNDDFMPPGRPFGLDDTFS